MPDTYSYRSVTQGYTVTWTRDDNGIWHADDERDATATDADIKLIELIEDDRSTFPDGHPCRDCDRLHKDHAPGPDEQCEGWR